MRRSMVLVALAGALLATVGPASPATQGRWVIRDLGAGAGTTGMLINDRGQVIWHKWECGECDNAADEYSIAYVWQKGRSVELTFRRHGFPSEANAINERGQIVGSDGHAVLWENGRVRDLGTLGGPQSEAVAINNRGQIVGSADTRTKDSDGYPISHAALWENGRVRDLGTLGGPGSRAIAINDRGQVIGLADTKAKDKDGFQVAHVALWENGKITDLGLWESWRQPELDINNRGQVVWPWNAHGILWHNGTKRRIGLSPSDINDRSQIVGSCGERACVWQGGKLTGLGTLGGDGSDARALNERGQVVGSAERKMWGGVAVLWTYKP